MAAKGDRVFFVLDFGANAGQTRPAVVVKVVPVENAPTEHSLTIFLEPEDSNANILLVREQVTLQNPIEPFQGTMRLEE